MIFTKNFKIILSALSCFLVSILSILMFILLSTPKPESLALQINDIYMEVGESKFINYNVNYRDAEVVFSITDTSIATIEGRKITAISEGSTVLRASATYNGEVTFTSCNIIVTSPPKISYHYEISILSGSESGYFEDNTLFMKDLLAFTISVYDDKDVLQDISNIEYDTNFLEQDIKTFYISPGFEGSLAFNCPSINFSFEISVKNLNKLTKNG